MNCTWVSVHEIFVKQKMLVQQLIYSDLKDVEKLSEMNAIIRLVSVSFFTLYI